MTTTEPMHANHRENWHPPRLRGRMGVIAVATAVIAFSAPLTVAWGYLPFVIFFAGVAAPVAFIVGMLVLLLFSVGYLRMSHEILNPGAYYSFITVGLNRVMGLGAGLLAALGYLLIGTGVYAFFGIVGNSVVTGVFDGPDIPWWAFSLIEFVIIGLLGYVGIEFSAKTLTVLLVIEVVIVALFDVFAFAHHGGHNGWTAEPLNVRAFAKGDVGLGVLYAIVMYVGVEATTVYRDETRKPRRTIPRATYLAVGFVGVFYALAAWALIMQVGTSRAVPMSASDPAGMFPNSFSALLGGTAKDVIFVFVITSAFASTLAIHNVFARYLFNLGADHVLPPVLGRSHPTQGSPYIASVVASIAGLVVVGSIIILGVDPSVFYGRVAGVASLCVFVTMLLCSTAVVVYFRKQARSGRDLPLWSTLVAPSLAVCVIAVAIVLALKNANSFMASTTGWTIIFFAIIVIVFLVGTLLAFYFKRNKPDIYQRIGRQIPTQDGPYVTGAPEESDAGSNDICADTIIYLPASAPELPDSARESQ